MLSNTTLTTHLFQSSRHHPYLRNLGQHHRSSSANMFTHFRNQQQQQQKDKKIIFSHDYARLAPNSNDACPKIATKTRNPNKNNATSPKKNAKFKLIRKFPVRSFFFISTLDRETLIQIWRFTCEAVWVTKSDSFLWFANRSRQWLAPNPVDLIWLCVVFGAWMCWCNVGGKLNGEESVLFVNFAHVLWTINTCCCVNSRISVMLTLAALMATKLLLISLRAMQHERWVSEQKHMFDPVFPR